MSEDLTYCSNYYRQVSFPNLIDHNKTEDAAKLFHTLFRNEFILENKFDCYPYLMKAACYLFFPKCIGTNESFIVPCNETWKELTEACFTELESASNTKNLLTSLLSSNGHFVNLPSLYFSNATFDYTYLPPLEESTPCYYEKVKCESPPNVTGTIIEGLNDTYYGGSTVEYFCIDHSKEIVGNSTVKCLYNGTWSATPVCRDRDSKNNLLKILLPTFILSWCLIVVVIIVYIHRRRRRNTFRNVILRRNREFDAYVCYDFDENNDYAMGILLPEFEWESGPSI